MSQKVSTLSPNLGTSRVNQRGGAGGGGNPDVVPGANPARKDLASGTASTSVTFVAPTGGSGSGFSYAAILSKPSGSSAALSGTGLGPYTVASMADGESYVVLFTATDAGDAQVANNFGLVDVAAATVQPTVFLIPNPTPSIDSITVAFINDAEFLIPNVTVVP
tara:strand:- start:477 stop:968 length:492 start_codon:yes stop_codon:yes gene_type:complete